MADLRWYWNPARGASSEVANVERATEHTGLLENAWLNVNPSLASAAIFGVLAP